MGCVCDGGSDSTLIYGNPQVQHPAQCVSQSEDTVFLPPTPGLEHQTWVHVATRGKGVRARYNSPGGWAKQPIRMVTAVVSGKHTKALKGHTEVQGCRGTF